MKKQKGVRSWIKEKIKAKVPRVVEVPVANGPLLAELEIALILKGTTIVPHVSLLRGVDFPAIAVSDPKGVRMCPIANLTLGVGPDVVVRHRNGNGFDCTRANLEATTQKYADSEMLFRSDVEYRRFWDSLHGRIDLMQAALRAVAEQKPS